MSTGAETFAIRDALLALCGRYPVPAMTLFGRLRDEWGELCERRLWRAINWLVAHGKLQRVGERSHSDGYVRVPDAAVGPDEAEPRHRLELYQESLCYDCERCKRHPKDPPWFTAQHSGYCFECYTGRQRARRSGAGEAAGVVLGEERASA